MCIILDNSVSGEVFGDGKSEASEAVWRWINGIEGKGKRLRVVVGGKLTQELNKNRQVRDWLIRNARRANLMIFDKELVDLKEKEVEDWDLKSNDPHIIALALVSGARLLYSNDLSLQKDFSNARFVGNPKGKVYTTAKYSKYDQVKKNLLEECKCVIEKQ